jgi:hypothetical protein
VKSPISAEEADLAVRTAAEAISVHVPRDQCSVVTLARTFKMFDSAIALCSAVNPPHGLGLSVVLFANHFDKAEEQLRIWAKSRHLEISEHAVLHGVRIVQVHFNGGCIRVHISPEVH